MSRIDRRVLWVREEGRGFVAAGERIIDHDISRGIRDFLCEESLHTSIGIGFEDVRAIDRDLSTVFRPIETEGERRTFDGCDDEDMSRSIVDEREIRFWDIDGRIHSVGFVIRYGVGMISPGGDFHAGSDRGPEAGDSGLRNPG